jgi:hypothetical protein
LVSVQKNVGVANAIKRRGQEMTHLKVFCSNAHDAVNVRITGFAAYFLWQR